MPKFIFNKLVRDKLRQEYERMNQKAVYRRLTPDEHATELKRKLIEEVNEIPDDLSGEQTANEIADIQQVLSDLMELKNISQDQVDKIRLAKLDKKGGFKHATFIENLELDENDEWVKYYRDKPAVFREVVNGVDKKSTFIVPELETGVYEHFKGNKYEVIGVGLDTETEEAVVIYRPFDGSGVSYWVRPYKMFIEDAELNGNLVPRFKRID